MILSLLFVAESAALNSYPAYFGVQMIRYCFRKKQGVRGTPLFFGFSTDFPAGEMVGNSGCVYTHPMLGKKVQIRYADLRICRVFTFPVREQ